MARAAPIGDASKDYRSLDVATDGAAARAIRPIGATARCSPGPSTSRVFDGRTGAALATTAYVPGREPQDGWGGIGGNGGTDNDGNRVDRFLAGVAYLDGRLPSVDHGPRLLRALGDRRLGLAATAAYVTLGLRLRQQPAAVSESERVAVLRPGQSQPRRSPTSTRDGRDEIVYGAMVIDDDGKGLFSTGLRHGDALHAGDLDPSRPGLEVFGIHENEEATVDLHTPGVALYDARSGEVVFGVLPGGDVGRGLAADIDPRFPWRRTVDQRAAGTSRRPGQAHR